MIGLRHYSQNSVGEGYITFTPLPEYDPAFHIICFCGKAYQTFKINKASQVKVLTNFFDPKPHLSHTHKIMSEQKSAINEREIEKERERECERGEKEIKRERDRQTDRLLFKL